VKSLCVERSSCRKSDLQRKRTRMSKDSTYCVGFYNSVVPTLIHPSRCDTTDTLIIIINITDKDIFLLKINNTYA
jgi:hypothetical protein